MMCSGLSTRGVSQPLFQERHDSSAGRFHDAMPAGATRHFPRAVPLDSRDNRARLPHAGVPAAPLPGR